MGGGCQRDEGKAREGKVKDDKSKGGCRRQVASRLVTSRHVASLFFAYGDAKSMSSSSGAERLTEYLPLIQTTFHRRNVFVVPRRNLRSLRAATAATAAAAALTFRGRDVATATRRGSRGSSFDRADRTTVTAC